ncbi:MAG: FtsH protease activity modulator HflK [Elusimicrobia bacterium]|nr:FtsH protease activity modulator HflK [Elusimicrobiota bacterium]
MKKIKEFSSVFISNFIQNFKRFIYRLQLSPMLLAIYGLVFLYIISGLYIVQTEEQGVVRRFGRVARDKIMPGIHYRLPWPVERLNKVPVQEIKRIIVGYYKDPLKKEDFKKIEDILTGDENLIHVSFMVQYTILEPASYLFNCEDPRGLLGYVAGAAMSKVVAGMDVDSVLTVEKIRVQEMVKSVSQETISRYNAGIQIRSVTLETVIPPQEVLDSFNEVISAQADRVRFINEAEGYANMAIPIAYGNAQVLVEGAKTYHVERINMAMGDSSRFYAVRSEYSRSPYTTKTRLYLETMEELMPNIKLYIVDPLSGRRGLDLKFLMFDDESPKLPVIK